VIKEYPILEMLFRNEGHCTSPLLIGFEGNPADPEDVYLIPLSKIKYIGLYPNAIKDYIVEFDLITSRELWGR
jgi:hypothetical protein